MHTNSSEKFQIDPSNFDFIKKIGQGTCSNTWKVKDKDTSQPYALKIIQNCKLSTNSSSFLSFLSNFHTYTHPNLIASYCHYSDIDNLYQVQELVEGGTLLNKLYNEKTFDEPTAFQYFIQLFSALEYLQHKNPSTAHGDLRLENVLLTKKGAAKVNCIGCANFLARGLGKFSEDLWNLGILLYELLCGCPTLTPAEKKRFFEGFSEHKLPKNLSHEAKDLLQLLLIQSEFATLEQVKRHPWVANKGVFLKQETENYANRDEHASIFSTNFTEVHATRESLTVFDLKEDSENDLEVLKILEYRVLLMQEEKKELERGEKRIKGLIEEADGQLRELESVCCSEEIFEQLDSAQTELFDKRQQCKKHRIHLETLKKLVNRSIKDLEDKEEHLKSLNDSVKTLNLGISRIKSHRSFDLSSLRINLDVLQYKIGEKSFKSGETSSISIQDLKELVAVRTDAIKFLTKGEYKTKILKCMTQTAEFQQKIADISLNYELKRGMILQSFSKIKEKLNLIIKKNREESFRSKIMKNEIENQSLSNNIIGIFKPNPEFLILTEKIQKESEKLSVKNIQALKEVLDAIYAKIKVMKKERFRNERKIDSRQLEIDDLKFEIHVLKSTISRNIWKSH